ncbi:MAG: hypothetical protein HC844_01935 [Tabrizicola sp.]|nr:hypothetical protein [Tabrizicola sp.]
MTEALSYDPARGWLTLATGTLLQRRGVAVARFLPPRILPPAIHINLRNHRKLLVVDGSAGKRLPFPLHNGSVLDCKHPHRLRLVATHHERQEPGDAEQTSRRVARSPLLSPPPPNMEPSCEFAVITVVQVCA